MGKFLKFSGLPVGQHTWFEDRAWRENPAYHPSKKEVLAELAPMTRELLVAKAQSIGLGDAVAAAPGMTEEDLRTLVATNLGFDHDVPWKGPIQRINRNEIVPAERFHLPGDGCCEKDEIDVASNFIVRGLAVVTDEKGNPPAAEKKKPAKEEVASDDAERR